MKFAIIFAFAAFALLAQTEAGPTSVERGIAVNRGAFVQALKIKLTQVKEKLDQLFQDAHEGLKVKIAEAKKVVENLIDQLSQQASNISDQVFQAAHEILDQADKFEDKIVEQAKNIIFKYGFKDEDKQESVEHVESTDEQ